MATPFSSPETAARVLRLLREQAVDGLVSTSFTDIAAELSVGKETAHRAVARLLSDGSVKVYRKGTGYLYPTTYSIAEVST